MSTLTQQFWAPALGVLGGQGRQTEMMAVLCSHALLWGGGVEPHQNPVATGGAESQTHSHVGREGGREVWGVVCALPPPPQPPNGGNRHFGKKSLPTAVPTAVNRLRTRSGNHPFACLPCKHPSVGPAPPMAHDPVGGGGARGGGGGAARFLTVCIRTQECVE